MRVPGAAAAHGVSDKALLLLFVGAGMAVLVLLIVVHGVDRGG